MCGSILGYRIPSYHIETTGSSTHFSQASGHCWTPISLNLLPSTPKPMVKSRSLIRWSCTSCACINIIIHVCGMRVFPMFSRTKTWLSISLSAITHFRWGCDSNPWVPLMLHYLLQPHRKNVPMFSLRPTKPPNSLSGFSTSANKSIRFLKNPMLSTRNSMINTGYCTSFRWETISSYIYRKSASKGPIRRFFHLFMGLTLSPRLWVTMLLSSTLPPSFNFTQCSMWTFFGHIFHHYWTPPRSQNK
jgi:hypothetical protein